MWKNLTGLCWKFPESGVYLKEVIYNEGSSKESNQGEGGVGEKDVEVRVEG